MDVTTQIFGNLELNTRFRSHDKGLWLRLQFYLGVSSIDMAQYIKSGTCSPILPKLCIGRICVLSLQTATKKPRSTKWQPKILLWWQELSTHATRVTSVHRVGQNEGMGRRDSDGGRWWINWAQEWWNQQQQHPPNPDPIPGLIHLHRSTWICTCNIVSVGPCCPIVAVGIYTRVLQQPNTAR